MEGLEKERDFYFGKLRDIEVQCQEEENGSGVVEKIKAILYATEVGTVTKHRHAMHARVIFFLRNVFRLLDI